MSSWPLTQFLKIPSLLIETSLVTMGSALSAAQRTVEMAMGQNKGPLTAPPVNGPTDIDALAASVHCNLAGVERGSIEYWTRVRILDYGGGSSSE